MDTQNTPATPASVTEGSIVPATVVSLASNAAVVSFGWKVDAPIPFDDFPRVDGKPAVKVGDKFDVLVEVLDDDAKEIVLSKDKAERLRRWDEVVATCKKGGPVEGTVLSREKGGYTVDVGLPAFLPASKASHRRLDDPDSLLGQTFTFEITEFDEGRMKIVLSRKAFAKKDEEEKRKEVLARLVEGAVLTGVVRSVADYGAFVELGAGVDGLLHVSQMSWTHVGHPREVVKVGQELRVQVLSHEVATGKIALGLKQLQENPWAHVPEKYPAGTHVEGKVSGMTEYGAFVELEPGIEGLVHVSEMSWTKKVKHPSELVKQGELVKAEVLHVDPEHRRISLGMRQLQANPWTVLAEKYPVGTTVHGKVRRMTEFGMFVELEEGIDGLVHVSELKWDTKVNHPSELYKEGDEVDALVLKVDADDQRIALSVKQLQPSPWKSFAEQHPVGSKLNARVVKIVDFGAFLEAAPGVEGLIHISELREERVERVADVLRIGQELEVQVIELDAGRRKVGFSVKALTAISPEEYRKHLQGGDAKVTLGDVFKDQLTKK